MSSPNSMVSLPPKSTLPTANRRVDCWCLTRCQDCPWSSACCGCWCGWHGHFEKAWGSLTSWIPSYPTCWSLLGKFRWGGSSRIVWKIVCRQYVHWSNIINSFEDLLALNWCAHLPMLMIWQAFALPQLLITLLWSTVSVGIIKKKHNKTKII